MGYILYQKCAPVREVKFTKEMEILKFRQFMFFLYSKLVSRNGDKSNTTIGSNFITVKPLFSTT